MVVIIIVIWVLTAIGGWHLWQWVRQEEKDFAEAFERQKQREGDGDENF